MITEDKVLLAKNVLTGVVEKIDPKLKEYWEVELSKNFGFNETQQELVKKMVCHMEEHNLRSAKRLRASLVLYGYLLGNNKECEEIWEVAQGIEIIHTALLMHDDFMDKDKVRRGMPTTQEYFANGDEHYGNGMAVMVGDAALCMGYEKVLCCGFDAEKTKQIMAKLLRGITNTAFGQAYDVSLPKIGNLNEEMVLSLHRAKTAIYTYENPLLIGAILGGVDSKYMEGLSKFSKLGGVAFQLQDDILGVFGDEKQTGKSANSDLLQGKVTLLVVKTWEMGSSEQKENLNKVWGKNEAADDEILLAKKAIIDSGAYEYSKKEAKRLAIEATEVINKLRNSGLNEDSLNYLDGIAAYMIERDL